MGTEVGAATVKNSMEAQEVKSRASTCSCNLASGDTSKVNKISVLGRSLHPMFSSISYNSNSSECGQLEADTSSPFLANNTVRASRASDHVCLAHTVSRCRARI